MKDEPFTHHDMWDPDKAPDKVLRTLVNRGEMQPTIGLRFFALDIANLVLTGKPKFASDLDEIETSTNSGF